MNHIFLVVLQGMAWDNPIQIRAEFIVCGPDWITLELKEKGGEARVVAAYPKDQVVSITREDAQANYQGGIEATVG